MSAQVADKFFLDTNLFVYSVTVDDPGKSRLATALIRRALSTQKGVVSYQIVQEFFNLALKRFARPMSLADCDDYLTTVFRPLLRVHSSTALYTEALAMHNRYRLSWYDSLIACAAMQAECAILYSEEMQHGQRLGTLQIQNPFL
jgi:predicted nucleic acid-binding protein